MLPSTSRFAPSGFLRVLVGSVLLLAPFVSAAETLTVTPAVAMTDQVVAIAATGLQPGEMVTIRSEMNDGGDHTWRAEAAFVADAHGSVDLSTQAPSGNGGSYRDVSPMGLIWSMRPESHDVAIYQPPRDYAPETVRFTLLRGSKPIASAKLERHLLAEGVKGARVNGDIHGVLFTPAEAGTHPGVLVLGGSEGGAPVRRAAWLASHGYTALALAYFRWPGLPDQLRDIPLGYVGKGLSWLSQQPGVSRDKIAVMGASRGGELALQVGSMYPMVRAVVAFVPANVRVQACCDGRGGAAWTWAGKPLPFATPGEQWPPASGSPAEIEVERIHGPVLLISGKDDGVWNSTGMTDSLVRRLREKHFTYTVTNLQYSHAGHRAGSPEIYPTWHTALRHPVSGKMEDLGGSPEGDASSTLEAAPAILSFLQSSLFGNGQ